MANEDNKTDRIDFSEAEIDAPTPSEVFTTGCGLGKVGPVFTDGIIRWTWVDKAGGVDRTYATGTIVDFTAVDVRLTFYDVVESTKIETLGHVHRLEKSVQVIVPLSAIRHFAAHLNELVNSHQTWISAEEDFAKLGLSVPSERAVSQAPNLKEVQ